MDFNPVVDRIRLVNSTNENFRINPNNGSSAGLDDSNLTFTAPATGPVTAVAYDRNFAGTTLTTLFGIDRGSNRLVRIGGVDGNPSPNLGAVTSVGSLGVVVDLGTDAAFDISGATGTAYAALFVGGVARLYTINLVTAAATLVGTIGDGTLPLRGFAVAPPQNVLVTGAGAGGGPHVRVFDDTGAAPIELLAYDVSFTGGVRVALCDVNGDGVLDIVTGAGAGGGPHVRVFDGRTGQPLADAIGSFFAFNPAFTEGLYVACTDLNGDGKADVIVGAGAGGGPHVQVFDGATGALVNHPLGSFFPYNPAFTGGVFVGGAH